MLTMTRRLTFSAAKADWLPQLSQQENEQLFGPNASPEPYGHNYALEVSVDGEIDPSTGILVNIKEIDKIVRERVLKVLDRKFLNRQVPAFQETPATSENMVDFIAETLREHLPSVVTLSGIRLEETADRSAEWRAANRKKEKGSVYVTRVYEFSASHRLHSPFLSDDANRDLFGKCNYDNGHGHNYIVEVTVAGLPDSETGSVVDTEKLDAIVHREVVDRYDHRHLNLDVPDFADLTPSAEIITKVIYERLQAHIPAPARLYRILLKETSRNIFEYYGEDEQ